jgi:hypothetical protein
MRICMVGALQLRNMAFERALRRQPIWPSAFRRITAVPDQISAPIQSRPVRLKDS